MLVLKSISTRIFPFLLDFAPTFVLFSNTQNKHRKIHGHFCKQGTNIKPCLADYILLSIIQHITIIIIIKLFSSVSV